VQACRVSWRIPPLRDRCVYRVNTKRKEIWTVSSRRSEGVAGCIQAPYGWGGGNAGSIGGCSEGGRSTLPSQTWTLGTEDQAARNGRCSSRRKGRASPTFGTRTERSGRRLNRGEALAWVLPLLFVVQKIRSHLQAGLGIANRKISAIISPPNLEGGDKSLNRLDLAASSCHPCSR
jgi:hypothetical protein